MSDLPADFAKALALSRYEAATRDLRNAEARVKIASDNLDAARTLWDAMREARREAQNEAECCRLARKETL